jgi:hypothetical protein
LSLDATVFSVIRFAYREEPFMKWRKRGVMRELVLLITIAALTGCFGSRQVYVDSNMDFGAVQKVAIMPFENLAGDRMAGQRVRDVLIAMLLSTGSVYVVPPGEVARGISRAGIRNPVAPTAEEVTKLGGIIKVDAVITGVLREYGTVRSGATSANLISVSLQLFETQTGKVVWTASSTKGGITVWDRLFGGGGKPMNEITEEAVGDLLNKLFR